MIGKIRSPERGRQPLAVIRLSRSVRADYLSPVRFRVSLAALGTIAALAACAKPPKPAPPSAGVTVSPTPLASLAGQRIIVLPVHYLRATDTLGLTTPLARPHDFLRSLDDEIAFAMAERGLRSQWVFPEDLARIAKRNAGHSADPYALAAEVLRPTGPRRIPQLPDPLASQLRSLVALSDARYALFPVEVRFENVGTTGRAVLHVALIDARASNIRWSGDIASDTMSTIPAGLAASLANRLANLIAGT
jgi:hypothetical protein